MLRLYHPGDDLSEFIDKIIPRTHLPKELGGLLGSLDELDKDTKERIIKNNDYFIFEEDLKNFKYEKYFPEHNYLLHTDD